MFEKEYWLSIVFGKCFEFFNLASGSAWHRNVCLVVRQVSAEVRYDEN